MYDREIFTSTHNQKAIFTVRCILIYDFAYEIECWREWKHLWMDCGGKRFSQWNRTHLPIIICLFWKWYRAFWCGSAYGFRLLLFTVNQRCCAATMKAFATDLTCNVTLQWSDRSDRDAANQIADFKSKSQMLTPQLQMPFRCHKQSIANLNHWFFSTCVRGVLLFFRLQ